jgi:hypothetical protein
MLSMVFSAFFHVAVIFLFSLVTLGIGISYAITPGERKLGMLRPMSVATLFSILSGVCAGLGASFLAVSESTNVIGSQESAHLFAGLAEASVPAVFGFTVLAVSWLLAAVGMRRQI